MKKKYHKTNSTNWSHKGLTIRYKRFYSYAILISSSLLILWVFIYIIYICIMFTIYKKLIIFLILDQYVFGILFKGNKFVHIYVYINILNILKTKI